MFIRVSAVKILSCTSKFKFPSMDDSNLKLWYKQTNSTELQYTEKATCIQKEILFLDKHCNNRSSSSEQAQTRENTDNVWKSDIPCIYIALVVLTLVLEMAIYSG